MELYTFTDQLESLSAASDSPLTWLFFEDPAELLIYHCSPPRLYPASARCLAPCPANDFIAVVRQGGAPRIGDRCFLLSTADENSNISQQSVICFLYSFSVA
jgi:hypothetical protein